MKRSGSIRYLYYGAACVGAGLLIALAVSSVMAETPASQPAKRTRNGILGDYAKITLTEEQRTNVIKIQSDTKAKIELLVDEERKQIEGMLTPEQIKELEDYRDQRRELSRKKAAERRAVGKSGADEDSSIKAGGKTKVEPAEDSSERSER